MATHKEIFEVLIEETTKINETLNKKNEAKKKRWEDSCFLPIREIHSNKSRGETLSQLVLTLIKFQGFDVRLRKRTKHESSVILIGENNGQMQIKTCMLSPKNLYTFQQIRKNDTFDALIFLGVSPQTAHLWVVNREVILDSSNEWIKRKNLNVQHKDIDKIITFDTKKIPEWLAPLGGTLDKGLEVFKKEVGRLDKIKQGS